jgi:glutathione S-transferase
MKLYYAPATSSLAAHIALRAADVDFELERVTFMGRPGYDKEATDDRGRNFYEINPRGYVPVLQLDDGTFLTECPAILLFIAENLQGTSTTDRYRLLELLSAISFELQNPVATLLLADLPETERIRLQTKISKRLTGFAERLGAESYLLGGAFSVADALLYTVLNWLASAKIDLGTWPALKDYRKRVGSLPVVDAALKAEGLRKA